MRKLPPSQKMRKEIEEILKGVPEDLDNRDILEEIIRKGAAIVLQEMFEQEVTEFLDAYSTQTPHLFQWKYPPYVTPLQKYNSKEKLQAQVILHLSAFCRTSFKYIESLIWQRYKK